MRMSQKTANKIAAVLFEAREACILQTEINGIDRAVSALADEFEKSETFNRKEFISISRGQLVDKNQFR